MARVVCGTYRIRNIVSGRFYIGSSENVYRRFEAHRRQLRAGTHKNISLQGSWSKHGEDAFKFEVLETVSPETVRNAERALLQRFFSHPLCCNMHDETYVFPRTGRKHTAATKAKISKKVQAALSQGRGGKFIPNPETRAKMSAALKGNQCAKGHVRTKEHRRKLSESAKGNKHWLGRAHSEASKSKMGRPVRMISPEGDVTVYPRTTAIKEQFGIFLPTIQRSVRSGKPLAKGPYKGWRFEYV
jgi:group I intron endonuclease